MNTPSPLRKLGGRIRGLRTDAGRTPDQLAAAARLETETLAAIEAGRHDPDYLTLMRIARALGTPLAALLAAMDEDEDRDADGTEDE